MLRVTDIHKTFNAGTVNEKQALRGVSLNLEDGEFVTVIGGNGAGKSTFLNAVAGVWPIDSGSIEIDGTDVTGLSEHVRAKYLGRVFQDPMTGTAADMEIEENLALAARRGKSRSPFRWGVTKEEHEKYRELLAQLDLGLEDRMTAKVLETTEKIVQANHLTTMMITHNMRDAIAHGNRLIMMNEGRIVLNIAGEEKKKLTIEDLLHKFEEVSGEEFANDKALLS